MICFIGKYLRCINGSMKFTGIKANHKNVAKNTPDKNLKCNS